MEEAGSRKTKSLSCSAGYPNSRSILIGDDMALEFDGSLSTVVEARDAPHVVNEHVTGPLSLELLDKIHRYWCAANYLTVGQIYLQDNPLLREPLRSDQIKKRLLGHWGTSTGLNFIYAHLNRVITEHNAAMICIIGPGHGGPAG